MTKAANHRHRKSLVMDLEANETSPSRMDQAEKVIPAPGAGWDGPLAYPWNPSTARPRLLFLVAVVLASGAAASSVSSKPWR